MTALRQILQSYREQSHTEREKGGYFEELILAYLRNEAAYKSQYGQVWRYGDWATERGLDARDTGIDLVARTRWTMPPKSLAVGRR